MQMINEKNDIGFSPSFSCYSSDSLTSSAAAKVSREFMHQHAADLQEFSDVEEEDFEFSLEFAGEEFSSEELALSGRILLPIFDTDLATKDEVESEVKELKNTNSSSVIIPLEKMLINATGDAVSYSSEEAEQVEDISTGTFCMTWRSGASAHIKKSKSTGSVSESGSRRWKVNDILRRSNSAGKETTFFLCPKRVEESNKKRTIKSAEAPKGAGKSKTGSAPSVHELFYVQKRAEQIGDKTRSYLPYRQVILGFQVQVNGNSNKRLPF